MTLGFASLLCSLLILSLGCGVTLAAQPSPAAASNNPVPVSIENKPVFSDIRAQLQAVVNTSGFHSVNRFCVVGYTTDSSDDYPFAYIYWPTQNKIIGWASASGQPILESGQFSDLKRDILRDGEVTDDYLNRSDVASILHDCWKHGSDYIIKRTKGGWVPISKFSQFSTIRDQLQDLVDHDAMRKRNKFCVIGQKDGAYLGAYVYWQTRHQLIFWLPDQNDQYVFDALTDPLMEIDLKHRLRDKEDAEDDRNEMQRSYAEAILNACQKSGKDFVITKSD